MISHVIIDSCCGIIQVTYKSQLAPERPTFDLKDLRLNRNDRPVSATLPPPRYQSMTSVNLHAPIAGST